MLTTGVISVIYLLAFDPSYESPASRVDAKDGHGKVARLERAEKRLKKGFQMRRVASGERFDPILRAEEFSVFCDLRF